MLQIFKFFLLLERQEVRIVDVVDDLRKLKQSKLRRKKKEEKSVNFPID